MRFRLLAGLAGVAVVLAASPTWAAPLEIDGFLANPSFENGVQGGQFIGCPVSWSCSNSFNQPQSDAHAYDPTTAQYASGNPPYGQFAVYVPENAIAGSSTFQQVTGTNWVGGTSYQFTFDVGMPTLTVNGTTEDRFKAGSAISVYLIDAVTQVIVGQYNITNPLSTGNGNAPGPGNWAEYVLSVIAPAAANGHAIEVKFFMSSGNQNQPLQIDFDIPLATPLPAAVWMFGSVVGLGGVFGLRRRKRKLA